MSGEVITIDGPAAAGKGTAARLLAQRLEFNYLESGQIYRAVAVAAKRWGVAFSDVAGLAAAAKRLAASPSLFAEVAADSEIGGEKTGAAASKVATVPAVREALLPLQRARRESPGLVADGRDMGSIVFPDARLKVFLTADAEARAKRRWMQLRQNGEKDVTMAAVRDELCERDDRDSGRRQSPLQAPAGCLLVNCTNLSARQVVDLLATAFRQNCKTPGY